MNILRHRNATHESVHDDHRRRWPRWASIGLLLVVLVLMTACGDTQPKTADGDGGVAGDGSGATGFSFAPDALGSTSPAVWIAAGKITGGKVTLEVRGRGIAKLAGVAFRLQAPADRWKVLSSERGSAFGGSSVVSSFKQQTDGALWAGLAYKGKAVTDATRSSVLAKLTVQLSGDRDIQLSFRPYHNLVLDDTTRAVKVTWLGGTFRAR